MYLFIMLSNVSVTIYTETYVYQTTLSSSLFTTLFFVFHFLEDRINVRRFRVSIIKPVLQSRSVTDVLCLTLDGPSFDFEGWLTTDARIPIWRVAVIVSHIFASLSF